MEKQYNFYLASPLFCEEDNKGLDLLEKFLDDHGLTYFSPRKDSNIHFEQGQTDRDQLAQMIFDKNDYGIRNSEFVLANTIGTRFNNAIYGDEGTYWEIGYATALDKPIITYNWKGYGLNLMISQIVVTHLEGLTYDNMEPLEVIPKILEDYKTDIRKVYSMKELCKNLRSKYFKKISEIV